MSTESNGILTLLRDITIFSNLDDNALMDLSARFAPVLAQAGDWIYQSGEQTAGFFILKEGELALYAGDPSKQKEDLLLIEGDYLGEESVFYEPRRKASVRAVSDARLLYLSNAAMQQIIENHPDVRTKVTVLSESRKLSARVKMPWLSKDEYVQVITRKHPLLLLGSMILPVLFFGILLLIVYGLLHNWIKTEVTQLYILLAGFGISTLWLTWNIANWANDYYIITNKRMVWVEKVAGFYDSRQEAPLSTLLTVGTRYTRLGNILGYADVIVRTFVGGIQFRNVKHAREIGQVIESYWERIKTSDLADEGEAMRQTLKLKLEGAEDDDLILFDYQNAQETEKPERVREINFFEWLFSDFFKVRYDAGGTTIYRKHWFTLIKGTFLPVLALTVFIWLTAAVATYNITFISRTPALVFSITAAVSAFLWLIYQYLDWRNDVFQLTDDQVIDIDRKPLGKEIRRSAPLENILSIEFKKLGIFGLIFNYGTVYITVGNTKLSFDHVYNPSEVQQDIFTRMGTRLEEKRRINVTQERERVSEWFKIYHEHSEQVRHQNEDETKKVQSMDGLNDE